MNDDMALKKLRELISDGKSYYDATTLLKHDGFTQLQIDNATAALKNNKKDTSFNSKLAESLIVVASAETNDKVTNNRRKGFSVYPGGGFPMVRIGSTLNSWWYFVPLLLFFCVVFYYFSK